MRLVQRQIDLIRENTNIYQLLISLCVLSILVAMHYFDERGWFFAPKLIFTVMIFSLAFRGIIIFQKSTKKLKE